MQGGYLRRYSRGIEPLAHRRFVCRDARDRLGARSEVGGKLR